MLLLQTSAKHSFVQWQTLRVAAEREEHERGNLPHDSHLDDALVITRQKKARDFRYLNIAGNLVQVGLRIRIEIGANDISRLNSVQHWGLKLFTELVRETKFKLSDNRIVMAFKRA
jgi:hypothetical protein